MRVLCHPGRFTSGTRVVMLKGRHKDGIGKERSIVRVSHSPDHFTRVLEELCTISRPDERIYTSASERSMWRSIREFKRRQLDADYDDDPERFYRGINERWVSSLMAPSSQASKLWLFDCDEADDVDRAMCELREHYDRPVDPYRYASKSGEHIVVQTFDRTRLSGCVRSLIHENPLILWAY